MRPTTPLGWQRGCSKNTDQNPIKKVWAGAFSCDGPCSVFGVAIRESDRKVRFILSDAVSRIYPMLKSANPGDRVAIIVTAEVAGGADWDKCDRDARHIEQWLERNLPDADGAGWISLSPDEAFATIQLAAVEVGAGLEEPYREGCTWL